MGMGAYITVNDTVVDCYKCKHFFNGFFTVSKNSNVNVSYEYEGGYGVIQCIIFIKNCQNGMLAKVMEMLKGSLAKVTGALAKLTGLPKLAQIPTAKRLVWYENFSCEKEDERGRCQSTHSLKLDSYGKKGDEVQLFICLANVESPISIEQNPDTIWPDFEATEPFFHRGYNSYLKRPLSNKHFY